MGIVIGILTAIEVVVALLLIGIILIQQTKHGGGLSGLGGSVTEAVFGATAGNVLTKITVILATVFLGVTLLLVVLTAHRREAKSVVERGAVAKKLELPAAQPGTPATTEAATPAEPIKDAAVAASAAAPTPVAPATTAPAESKPAVPPAPAGDQPKK